MRKAGQSLPQVERLEGKALLSGLARSVAAPSFLVAAERDRHRSLNLAGSLDVVYSALPDRLDTMPVVLRGTGAVRPLGGVELDGAITSGAVADDVHLKMTLRNTRGSVNIEILPSHRISAAASGHQRFRYVIRGGTGAYDDAAGGGSVEETMRPDATLPPLSGRLTLDFSAGRAHP